jgi:predicted permease
MWNDLRFAARTLRRSPGFVALTVFTLALGIGANTAVFSLLYQVVLRSVLVKDPASLVVLESDSYHRGLSRSDNSHSVFSYPMYKELRDRNQVFSGLIARALFPATLAFHGSAATTTAEVVTGNFFETLGVKPVLGRLLVPADDQRGAQTNAIVLSYSYWAGHLGSDPNVLNNQVLMNNHAVLVVGVAQRAFRSLVSGNTPDFFAPISMIGMISADWDKSEEPDSNWLNICGRLKPGVAEAQANAMLLPLFRSVMTSELPRFHDLDENARKKLLGKPVNVRPAAQGLNELRSQWQTPLLVLMFMVGLVLLIACANVANLLIVRAVSRQREIAVRLAIGATRAQISRQLLVENTVLSLAGGCLGIFAAKFFIDALLAVLPADATGGWLSSQLDWRILLFSLALSVLTGIIFGLAPELQTTRPELASTLKDQSLNVSGTGTQSRTRQTLVAAQICLSLLLLIGAGLFTRSLVNLLYYDPGFQPEHVLTFSIDPTLSGYSRERAAVLFRELDQKFRNLPGAVSSAVGEFSPFGGMNWTSGVKRPGSEKGSESISVRENAAGPTYFQTLGIPLLSGRTFADTDTRASARVAIFNQTLSRFLFENENPIGRHIKMGQQGTDMEVVGVVKDSKFGSLREKPSPFLYVPKEQADEKFLGLAAFFLRTRGSESSMMNAVRMTVKQLDPNVPVDHLTSMKVMVDDSIYTDRLIAILAAGFGVLAVVLAAVGLYGTISYAVTRRTREFGIRLAMGAERKNILSLIFREIGILLGIGAAVGLPTSYALARLVESQLFGIKAHDPMVLLAAVVLIVIAAAIAGLTPALRAIRIEPLQALRYE